MKLQSVLKSRDCRYFCWRTTVTMQPGYCTYTCLPCVFPPTFLTFWKREFVSLPFFLVSTSTAKWPAKPGFIFRLLNHSSFQFQLLNAHCCPAKSLYPVIKSPINLPFSSFISCNMTTQGSPSRLGKRLCSAFYLLLLLELKHHNWTQHPCRFKQPDLCTLQQSLLFNSTFITRDYISPISFSFRVHVMCLPTLTPNSSSLTVCFPREKRLYLWDERVSHILHYIWLNKTNFLRTI